MSRNVNDLAGVCGLPTVTSREGRVSRNLDDIYQEQELNLSRPARDV